ncbi:ATP-binding protein [Bradyrhizobium sp.]|uniref:ATP-binding protein n=1 Tax=Bradyrhizobium sp. TaxID=376 RepID=UPI001EC7509C|nr:ATP-binding protein [Bradyrhizobium sp.]MBV9460007.1 hypothetical protein [Bradyrhizobium sp.]MBV9981813.1 hypothetical protein [Bradyrhizobium sp.]
MSTKASWSWRWSTSPERAGCDAGWGALLAADNVTLTGAETDARIAGAFVAVRVTDTGSDTAPDVLPKIFDPFFTAKEVGKGSGLGLSQVHGFAHQSGGTVHIES